MDAQSAAAGRYFDGSGASELAPTADCAVDLPFHSDVSRGRSDLITWDGQTIVFDDADEAADSLSHVLIL
jgi:hypothetical protein